MQFNVLITNNGKHSDEKLAIATAEDIVHVGATAVGRDPLDARKLANQIAMILEHKFEAISQFEHDGIQRNGTAHLAEPMTVNQAILEDAVTDVAAAIDASPFALWPSFIEEKSSGYPYLRKSIATRLGAAQHMHRDWFAKVGKIGNGQNLVEARAYDPECPHVKRWLSANVQGDVQ